MTNKMTNKKALTIALTHFQDYLNDGVETDSIDGVEYSIPEVVAKLESMIAALNNKATTTKRNPTAKQTENAGLRKKIMDFFLGYEGDALTCTEIGKSIPELTDMNNQRISALMRGLVDEGSIGKATVKGKSVFFLNAVEEEEDEEE